jgi:hypothetical protein
MPSPPPLGERGRQGVKERGNPLRWRISLGTRLKMPKMPPPPGRRGTRRNAAAGEEETRDSGARKYIAVGDLAPLLGGLPQRDKEKRSDKTHCGGGCRSVTRGGRGKIVASEDFAASMLLLLYLYIFNL